MGIKDSDQPKRSRTKYTTEQLAALERAFCISQYPDTATMEDLADMCNVSTEKISTWFQNRRSKFKRQSKDTNIMWMRKHIFNRDSETATKQAGGHVLSPPTENCNNVPRKNLQYMPVVSTGYHPPPTPFYPPPLPYDMFSDILRDIKADQDSPSSSEHSTPVQSSRQQTSESQSLLVSPPQASPPNLQECPPLVSEQSSVLQNSPLHHGSSPNGSPFQSPVLDISSDSSLSPTQQTTPPHPYFHMQPQGHVNLHSYYLNQTYQWHYFQTAQCMYRR